MNRFWLITKVQLMNVFRQSKRQKTMLNMGSYTIGALIMAAVGIYYSIMLFSTLDPSQYIGVPYFMVYMITFMVFIMGISTSRGMLFGFKDLDLLKAMPFTEREIVFSKITVFTLTEYAYAGAFFLPVIVIFGIKAGMGVLFYLSSIIGFITLPLVPIALASLLGMGLEKISAGRKHSDLIRNLTSVTIFLLIYGVSMYAGFTSGAAGSGSYLGMNVYLEKFMIVSKWYMEGAVTGNLLLLLASMGISVAVYALFLYFYSGTVMKINEITDQGYHVKNFQVKEVKANGVFYTLYKKERDRFFKNFLYVFNTAFGMILLIAAAIYLMFNRSTVIDVVSQIIQSNDEFNALISQLFILIIVFFGQMTCTTSSSISLEGKSLWIMKTLPVTVKQVFWSKIMVNFLLIMIPSTISLVLLGIVFGLNLSYYLLGILFIIASAFGISVFGLVINLQFPKLEYENDQEVIKQSMSAFLGVMVPMFAGMGMLMLFLTSGDGMPNLFYVFLGVYAALDAVLYFILMHRGKKQYNSLI